VDAPIRRAGLTTTTPVTQDRDKATYKWTDRHAAILARNRTCKPDVVVFGDSIMHYWGGEPVAPRVWGAEAWSNTFAGLKVTNLGFGWDRTENVLWRIDNGELDGIEPRAVVIKIGTNNTGLNTPEEIAAGIEAVCTAVLEKLPRTKILLLGVLPRRDEKPGQWAMSDRVNFLVQTRLSGVDRVTIRDFGNHLRKPDGSIDVSFYRDGVHVNAAGYAVLGERIRKSLDAL
jgi:lysophospholipase L1-like esterase